MAESMAESIARSIVHPRSALLNTIVHDDVIISPPGPLKFLCFFILLLLLIYLRKPRNSVPCENFRYIQYVPSLYQYY